MSDPLASSFDSLVGALAAASALLGRPVGARDALVASGRAFRLSVDDHLRVVPPSPGEIDEALGALGIGRAQGSLEAHEGPLLVWGAGGEAFGLGARRGEELVLRTPLQAGELRVPLERLKGAKLLAVSIAGLVTPRPVDRGAVAKDELARSPYRAWSRVFATHPLSRLDPAGNAWTLAQAEEARAAAASLLSDPDLDAERAVLAELRRLFPLPEGGSLAAAHLERGSELLERAARHREAWLRRLAAA